jgi:hypothetical protein
MDALGAVVLLLGFVAARDEDARVHRRRSNAFWECRFVRWHAGDPSV